MEPALDREVDSVLRGAGGAGSSAIVDLPSVRVSGAINIARARVLWKGGTLRFYGKKGLIRQLTDTELEPVNKRWRRLWVADTEYGLLELSAKCSTCGGWSKVTRIPAEELWG